MSCIIADENQLEINKAIIVCKAFHARRCLMLYQLAFPKVELDVYKRQVSTCQFRVPIYNIPIILEKFNRFFEI